MKCREWEAEEEEEKPEKKRYKKNEKENSLKRGDGTGGMRYPRRGRARE